MLLVRAIKGMAHGAPLGLLLLLLCLFYELSEYSLSSWRFQLQLMVVL
jgi:hypothetical protein